MHTNKKWVGALAAVLGLGVAGIAVLPGKAFSFTQGVTHAGSVVPMGHEWITRQAAIEVLGGERWLPVDPNDPRKNWPATALGTDTGLGGADTEANRIRKLVIAKDADDRFAAIYKPVFDAIIGERWVDIGGVNLAEAKLFDTIDCLDAVTQEPPDVQYDHYMRKTSDVDAQGGVTSARESTQRFVDYFVAAAMAPDGDLQAWDGGGWSVKLTVDRHYFLFGRALHLFEDSFSPDHTVRTADDYFRKVRQVKSYVCANGSEQHAHASPIHNASEFYASGDVIWTSMEGRKGAEDWSAYLPSKMRDYALAATEGTKETWAAFIRSMAKPRNAREAFARGEAQKVAAKWLAFDERELRGWYSVPERRKATYVKATPANQSEDGGKGTTVDQCMARDWKGSSQAGKLLEHANNRRTCLYNMLATGSDGNVDASLRLPFDWRWRDASKLVTPPKDWQIEKPRLETVQVKLANRVNQTYMRQDSRYIYNDPVKNPKNVVIDVTYNPAIPLVQNSLTFPVNGDPGYYVSRWSNSWGRADIFSGDDKGHFSLDRRADGYYSIKNIDDNQYMYMEDNEKTYINSNGKPENRNAQWRIDGMPEPYLVSGTYTATLKDSYKGLVGGTNGKVVVGPDPLKSTLFLDRQTDGSYKIRLLFTTVRNGVYARENPDHTLSADPSSGTNFYLEQGQRPGDLTIRTADGRYWFANPKVSGTPFITVDVDACMYDPCMPVISFGGADATGRGPKAAPPPPECRGGPVKECQVPQVFTITRDWATDDR